MEIPVQIRFLGMAPDPALEARALECAAKLERFYDRITRCDVAIELPHRQQRKGNHIHVRIDLTVPGKEIVVSHDPGPDETHEDARAALRDAFDAARRQLEDHARMQRGELKRHGTPGGDSMSSMRMAGARRS